MGDEPGGSGRRRFPRRSLLVAGATGGLVLGTTGALGPLTDVAADVLGVSRAPSAQEAITVERVRSRARGRDVNLVTILPAGVSTTWLPACLLLHGLNADAQHAAPAGLAEQLSAAVSRGRIPPFAFVAVDGGNNYWHDNRGDNAMAMLLDEVPGWLADRRLGDANGVPFACAGISMGGFGSLLYARRRNELGNPLRASAAISPGLLTSWREMSTRRAFRDNHQWASLDPLRNVDKLGTVPIGIWCGTEDHFIEGTRKFIKLAKPEVGYTGPGGHGHSFYRRIVPDVLAFLGKHTPGGRR